MPNNLPKTRPDLGSKLARRVIMCVPYQTLTAGLNIGHSRVLCWLCLHSTLLRSVVTSLEVSEMYSRHKKTNLFSSNHSTRIGWQCRSLEAFAGCHLLELHHSPNIHRGWHPPRSHPICPRIPTRSCRSGYLTPFFRRSSLYWINPYIQEALEGHCCKFG